MSTHNISSFYGEIKKIIPKLLPNVPLEQVLCDQGLHCLPPIQQILDTSTDSKINVCFLI